MTRKTTRRSLRARQPRRTRRPKAANTGDIADRLFEKGPQVLSDGELLSLFLRTDARRTSLDESFRLLTEYGSLRNLLSISSHQAASGRISRYNHIILQAVLELARRHFRERMMSMPAMTSSDTVHEFVRSQLRDRDYEVFCCLFLDTQMRVREFKEMFRGSIKAAYVYVGEVVKIALARNAAAVIAVHNHPSGPAEPTAHDRLVTLRLKSALDLVDIDLLDHVIVADERCESLAKHGLL